MGVEPCLSQRPEWSPRPVQQPGGHRRPPAMQPAVAHTQRPKPADVLRVKQTQERGKGRRRTSDDPPRTAAHHPARRQRERRSRPILDLPAPLYRPWHARAQARQSAHEGVLHLIGRTGSGRSRAIRSANHPSRRSTRHASLASPRPGVTGEPGRCRGSQHPRHRGVRSTRSHRTGRSRPFPRLACPHSHPQSWVDDGGLCFRSAARSRSRLSLLTATDAAVWGGGPGEVPT